MLPSTGYFKAIICPFYENGCCERPYCHFKHLRRDDSSSLPISAPQAQASEASQNVEETAAAVSTTAANSDIHQLVNEAVKKLLGSQEVSNTQSMTDKIVAQVVEQLKPSIPPAAAVRAPEPVAASAIGKHLGVPSCVMKPAPCVYNPTPISELKKRHIPVPAYMPTRESKVAAKRKATSGVTSKPWLGMLGESTANSEASEVTYKPTAIANISQEQDPSKTYIPTVRSDNSSSNSYDDGNSSDYVTKVKEAYYPKSKKRREEYVPKKVKAPLKSVQQLDETILDDFEPEFNIIDDILTSAANATSNDDQPIVINDDSENLYEIEAKFSEDEEEIITHVATTKKVDPGDEGDVEIPGDGKENDVREISKIDGKQHGDKSRSRSSHASHRSKSEKSSDGSSSKKNHHSRRDSSDKKKVKKDSGKSDIKKEDDERRQKNQHKSSGKNEERSKKDSKDKSSSRDKHKQRSSSTKEKSRTSSSSSSVREKDKSKDSGHKNDDKKESSHKSSRDGSSSGTSKSSRDKVPSSKSSDGKSRDKSRHVHQSSSTKTKNPEKMANNKNSDKKNSSRSHKSSKWKEKEEKKRAESGSDTSITEQEDHSFSPFESNLIDDDLMETSDSDHNVEEECLKIFQEYDPSERSRGVTQREPQKREIAEVEDVGRKRVAHPSASESVMRKHRSDQPKKKDPNPEQRMYDRWRTMKDAAAEKAAERSAALALLQSSSSDGEKLTKGQGIPGKCDAPPAISNIMSKASAEHAQANGTAGNRVRIAHVPYAMALALKKKKVNETKAAAEAKALLESKTVAQTARGSRVAHIPQVVPQLVSPEPIQVTTQKFPITVRQYYVNLMHVICVQIYTNGEDAAQRALREELACHDRCKALTVYKNSCMLAAHRLRKELEQGSNGEESLPCASGIVSHNAVLAGKSKGSWSVEKSKKSVMDYRGVALYERLKKWIAVEQQLRDNGYPRSHPDGPKGRAKIYSTNTRNHSILSKVPNERYCCRCGKAFIVNKHGLPVQQQNCIYHWGRKFTSRGESKYNCCQQFGFASGCADAKNHVWDYVDYENLRGYVKTLPRDVPPEEQGVYALDCEMSYTTQGLELTRVTVINDNCDTIYETLVMPDNPIIDYNTRYSGITEESMNGVTTTLLDVQATLLTMFSAHTILIGHSLESDFKALKLIHDTVVDTSMMFPHKNGPPYKRALRNLCSDYLRKIIQNEVGGHDSTEDAVACMDLIHWKVKEEAKLQ